jgi:hypothetical protein
MSAWEREIGELPSPTFVPVGRKAGGHVCFFLSSLKAPALRDEFAKQITNAAKSNWPALEQDFAFTKPDELISSQESMAFPTQHEVEAPLLRVIHELGGQAAPKQFTRKSPLISHSSVKKT